MPESLSTLSRMTEGLLRFYSRITPTERGGYRLARFARRFRQREQWLDYFDTPDGLRMNLDLGTYPDCCMAYGLYELDTVRVVKQLLRRGDHFIDAGANIGYFTLLAAQIVGPVGRVDAFEPHPANRARLLEHLRANGVEDRVRVHDVALSDHAGTATMHMPHGGSSNHGMASLFEITGLQSDSVEVSTARMDEVLKGTTPALVKIDVEGAEAMVVRGMEGLVKTARPPAIVAEYNLPASRNAGVQPREFV